MSNSDISGAVSERPETDTPTADTQSGAVPGTRKCPIDFNHESPEHAADWVGDFRQIRETCPLSFSKQHGGFWVASRYSDIIEIAQKPAQFTNGKTYDPETGEVTGGISIPTLPAPRGIPDETDSPEWDLFRSFLNRRLAPKAAEARRPFAEKVAAALINRVIETGRMDMVDDLTNPLPAIVTMDFFGLPLAEWRDFADPLHRMLFTPKTSPDFLDTVEGLNRMERRVLEVVEEKRRQEPDDGLLSYMVHGQVDGKPLDNDTIWQISFNLLAGGVDTTTALTSNVFLHLFQHPEQRQQLRDNPALWPTAREEFVRYFSPIHGLGRNVSEDMEMKGHELRKGERVYLAYSGGNRDPEIFDDPDTVKLDRMPNRHIGFGAGQHRCIGSFLARVMFETMLKEVLTRLPDYRIDTEKAEGYPSVAIVNGWINMPATFTPGPKVEVDFEL